MIRRWLCVFLLFFSSQVSYATGIDEEFGGKSYWWTPHYNELLSYLGLEKSYALVIGVGQYDNNAFDKLPSENDAKLMKDYLINEAGFDSVRLITGDKVTPQRIQSLMLNHYRRVLTEKDRFLFYWSGHGVTESGTGRQQGFLATKSSSPGDIGNMLGMQNLSSWDNLLKAKQTLYLLDACFSGIAASKAMSVRQEQTIERVNRPSRQVLAAGLENEQTIAINDLGSGVFTKALLDGLRGRADSSKGYFKQDGVVTARELEEYVRDRVDRERRRVRWPDQITPVLYNFSQYAGDFFFVWDKRVVKSSVLKKRGNRTVAEGVVAAGTQLRVPQKSAIQVNEKIIRLPNNLNLVQIPAGQFQMGSNIHNSEKPIHTVTISRPFWMSETEVTFDQYDTYATATGRAKINDQDWGRGIRPVINTSWNDAQGYVKWLTENNQQDLQCRLPSEAEWEYAARAGSRTAYSWGEEVDRNRANCDGCGSRWDNKQTAPVGRFAANAFGLKDMHGNVWEWIQDCWNGNYQEGPPVNGTPWTSGQCSNRVIRGGSWNSSPYSLRSAERSFNPPIGQLKNIGIRVICSLPSTR